jgi:hypothetical protein
MSDSLGEILIETAVGDFTDLIHPGGGKGKILRVTLAEKHETPPIVTIAVQENPDNSAYNCFINDVTEISLHTYRVEIGISGIDDALDAFPATPPLIQIHAISYR